jgi:hypothetical protein
MTFDRLMITITGIILLATALVMGIITQYEVRAQNKKLPEGQTCSNTFDTDADHKCDCMTDMKCPMKKPEPCYDEEGDCPQPDNGPDSTKCISPNCKKDACKCANPCKS